MGLPSIQQAFDLAIQHHQAGRLREAEPLYRQILAQQPEHAGALQCLGLLAAQGGRADVAVNLIRRALALEPNNYKSHYNLGNALREQGQMDQAIAAYRQALSLQPNFPEALINLGTSLKATGHLNEAIATFGQAIAISPGFPEAHNNLGLALRDKGQMDQAVAAFGQAIALRPNYADAYNNLGFTLHGKGQLDEAIAACRQAMALKPNNAEAHSNVILFMHYHPGCDAPAIAQEQRRWNQRHAAPLQKYIQIHANDRNPDRRLRIGYVSADFCRHASAYFLVPLLEHHDPQQVELFCYAQNVRSDEITRRLQPRFAAWRSTVGRSDEQMAQQIRADEIDILVDLKLHTGNNRLLVFARKPAPVQVCWLGYPGSTGLTTIDYRLSDPYLDPFDTAQGRPPGMDESLYSEQTIRLPDCFWCYDPLDGQETPVNPLPALASGRVTFGCLNNFCKINEGILALWASVLRQVANSRLLLLAGEGDHRQRTLDWMAKQGVDPARVEFVTRQSRREYLELYHRIDVGLDSFPYNGHTTSLDSFWMGVPVVTLVGQTAVSRAGWCQLSNLGLANLAGQTPEQFVRIAVDLAHDLPRLQELRATLRPRMKASPLMDASRFARNVEAAYRQMWRKWTSASTVKPCAT